MRLRGKRLDKSDYLRTDPERGGSFVEIYTLASIIAVMIATIVVTREAEDNSQFTKSARKKR